MKYTHTTKLHGIVTVSIKRNKVHFHSTMPIKAFNMDACYMFDLLQHGLSTKSKDICIRRRARQLNGMSLVEACK